MPRLDGTGPRGQGPRTGRGMGNCPGIGGTGRGFGLGRGMGWGMGRGWGFGPACFGCPLCGNQSLTKEDQKKILLEEKDLIEKELANLEGDK